MQLRLQLLPRWSRQWSQLWTGQSAHNLQFWNLRLRPSRIVVEKSCINKPFLKLLRTHVRNILQRPGRFAVSRPYLLVFGLYFGTFGIANITTTISDSRFFTLDPTMAKAFTVFATLSVNVPLGIYKDTVFSR